MSARLDMALDDMIEPSWGKGSSKGKASSYGGSWGGRDWESGGKGRDAGSKDKDRKEGKPESKLDMSLDEVIETLDISWGRKGGKGQSKSGGSSSFSYWASGSSWDKGSSWEKGGRDEGYWGKGRDKGGWSAGGGKGVPQWMGHDDWRGDEREGGSGRDSWRSGGGSWDADNASSWRGRGEAGGRTNGEMAAGGRSADGWRSGGADKPPVSGSRLNGDRASTRPVDSEWHRGGGPAKRPREESRLPTTTGTGMGIKKIKVTNIPKDLEARDIKGAFEAEAGKTTECKLERGVAYITFMTPDAARKAVNNFDRGELNGNIISVTLVP